MTNFKKRIMVTCLGVALTFAGCGTQKPGQAKKGVQNQTKQEVPPISQKTYTIQEGTKNMRDVIKEMKNEINNKEEDKAIKTSENLEANWKIFEDGVKEKYFTLYEKVEDPLHIINAVVKVKPLDAKILNLSIDNLDKQLEQLQKAQH